MDFDVGQIILRLTLFRGCEFAYLVQAVKFLIFQQPVKSLKTLKEKWHIAALCIGGETAKEICEFIYKTFFPKVIKTSTILVLIGLVVMYLNGEKALTASADKAKRAQHKKQAYLSVDGMCKY